MLNFTDRILLIGHGSPKKEANNIEVIRKLLHHAVHPQCSRDCVKIAYLQFAEPGLMTAFKECIDEGAKKIIVHPFFLSSGMHVTKDIPQMIEEAKGLYPKVEFLYSDPLGVHNKLVEVVLERIYSANSRKPLDIEKKSFEIISKEDDFSDILPEQLPVIKRVIHATADFEFRKSMIFHPDAINAGLKAIRAGMDILTDVEMVKTGINKKLLGQWGGKVICNIQNAERRTQNADNPPSPPFSKRGMGGSVSELRTLNSELNKTRAEMGIELALTGSNNIGIIAIGNAPTALMKVIDMLSKSPSQEILVIGVPVGFVNALESKTLLSAQKFPFITNLSRKGGTPVAVAIVNALLKMAENKFKIQD